MDYHETLMVLVNCPCGVQVRGAEKFYCTNCKRVFETRVSYGEPAVSYYNSYDDLYKMFLAADSEDGLGYNRTALNAMLAKVTEDMPDSKEWLVNSDITAKEPFRFGIVNTIGILIALICCVCIPILVHL